MAAAAITAAIRVQTPSHARSTIFFLQAVIAVIPVTPAIPAPMQGAAAGSGAAVR